MAGHGPAPKDPARRARRNADPIAHRTIPLALAPQPALPVVMVPDGDGGTRRFTWPAITRRWWQMWADSPLSAQFSATDWSELLDTAMLHARYWTGEIKLAGELRLRTSKHGATADDRARLRIEVAAADEAELKSVERWSSARSRFPTMRIHSERSPALESDPSLLRPSTSHEDLLHPRT